MPRKLIVDWDEYFEHRQEVQYKFWRSVYKHKIDEARDKDIARQRYSTLFEGIDLVTTPESIVGFSIRPELVNPAYELKADYYNNLYISFKLTWQLHERKATTIFLKNTAPEIVRMYRLRMVHLTDKFNWEAQLNAQTEAAEYVTSYLGIKKIVDWIVFCIARERFSQYIVKEQYLEVQAGSDSITEPITVPVVEESKKSTLTSQSSLSKKKSKGPNKETTRTDYQLIVNEIKVLMDKGMSKRLAMKQTSETFNRSIRAIYVAIEGAGI